ncbi:hypothetical protein J1614_011686 [Plenodomus biglobosus]|nr:hypothetical protein J1614_011686 [Plenodomus biglobosus]
MPEDAHTTPIAVMPEPVVTERTGIKAAVMETRATSSTAVQMTGNEDIPTSTPATLTAIPTKEATVMKSSATTGAGQMLMGSARSSAPTVAWSQSSLPSTSALPTAGQADGSKHSASW